MVMLVVFVVFVMVLPIFLVMLVLGIRGARLQTEGRRTKQHDDSQQNRNDCFHV